MNSDYDLLILGGEVVSHSGVAKVNIGIADGQIAGVGMAVHGKAAEMIDAEGLHIFPGLIDSHVHFNEPGRARWEGFETGSRALAAGGGTLFFEMPLNASPPTTDPAAFDLKLSAARAASILDFGFWGGIVPGNLRHLGALAEKGVVGFKAFMANSGIEDFPCVDLKTLRAGMREAASHGRLVAVHAESEEITARLTKQAAANGNTTVRDYLSTRPIEAELDAIRAAIDLAGETGCALHIVHVSCGPGVALVATARDRGVNVTCETCPHYLSLTEEDMERLGAPAKCAPPLRSASVQQDLWQRLLAGEVSTIGSDHSPAPPEMKTSGNFFQVWGGISGIQHTLPVMLSEGYLKRGAPLPLLARLTSWNVAARLGLDARKGRIEPGADADLALIDLRATESPSRDSLLDRHKQSPYVNRALTGRITRTILRGRTVFCDGKIAAKAGGRLIRPMTPPAPPKSL